LRRLLKNSLRAGFWEGQDSNRAVWEGHDFSRAVKAFALSRALAPEVRCLARCLRLP